MPRIVEFLTEDEKIIEQDVRKKFSNEQMRAYFLSKTIRSIYQFDDKFVADWYEEIKGHKPTQNSEIRRELVLAYAQMLMFENKYQFHLDYWIRQIQRNILTEMDIFFSGEPGK